MNAPSLRPAIDELTRMFEFFETKLWCAPQNRDLPMPVITIQSAGRSRSRGWFCANRWVRKSDGYRVPELNISTEHLASDPDEIAETMLHEMAHLDCWVTGKRDVTSNQYHNKYFRHACENIGLMVRRNDDGRGWSDTSLTPELHELIGELSIREEAFELFRPGGEVRPTKHIKKRVSWVCGCPKDNLVTRAAQSDLFARCLVCGDQFIRIS